MAIKIKRHRRVSTADTNEELIQDGPRMLESVIAVNNNVSAMFLKIYDKATAPVAGTDTPVLTLKIPANGVMETGALGLCSRFELENGLGMAITSGMGDSDTGAAPAGDVIVHILYA